MPTFQLNNELAINKNRTNKNKFHLSCFVASQGIEPRPGEPESPVLSIKLRSHTVFQALQR